MTPDFDIRAVTVASAVEWARGRIHDSQLVPGPEIVFWNELGDIGSYRAALRRICDLAGVRPQTSIATCKAMIVHACHPVVWRKLEREGCVCTSHEQIEWRGNWKPARRYVAPPVNFAAWLAKLHP